MLTVPRMPAGEAELSPAVRLDAMRSAQAGWAATPIARRMRVLRRFRAELATGAQEFSATVPVAYPGHLSRSEADTLITEVLPLAEACRFLEKEAAFILAPRVESSKNRPFWLRNVEVCVEHAPLGVVLLLAPGNYPLFLAGAQALQALAAGNAVLWKPASSGVACAHAMRVMLIASGLPPDLLTILDPAPAIATAFITEGVDKVFLTGSAATGEAVLHALAASATPAVMELSGCDAVFVLEGADLSRVVEALIFGLRLNGSATCMAPRRVFVESRSADRLAVALHAALIGFAPVSVPLRSTSLLAECLEDARQHGAQVLLDGLPVEKPGFSSAPGTCMVGASLIADASPTLRITRTDLFAPVLSLMSFRTVPNAVAMHRECPYALTAAIFGPAPKARELASQLNVGTVVINDLIVPTADPRVPFSGRKRSGFGATRGREGLLEMTAPRAIVQQRSKSTMAYKPTTQAHGQLFAGYLQASHAQGWRNRLQGLRAMAAAMPGLGRALGREPKTFRKYT
jgi:acyl-CoA reductase-like NAD-dependent aldehyde dehydrogenase